MQVIIAHKWNACAYLCERELCDHSTECEQQKKTQNKREKSVCHTYVQLCTHRIQ